MTNESQHQSPQPTPERAATWAPDPLTDAALGAAAGHRTDTGTPCRRREGRVPADLVIFTYPLGRDGESAPTRSASGDVSTAGMFVATDRPQPVGRVLWLEAFPEGSDEAPLCTRAVVRWRRRWLEPRGMGVELLDVADEDRGRLRRWMGDAARREGAG